MPKIRASVFTILIALLILNAAGQPMYFEWVKQLYSQRGWNLGTDIHFEPISNTIYITGSFTDSTYFNPSSNAQLEECEALFSGYLLKTDADGNFLWINTIKGSGKSWGLTLTTDNKKNVYVAGRFNDTIFFDTNSSVYVSNGFSDGFLAKYDEFGNFLWAYTFGSTWHDQVNSVVSNNNGEIFLTGYFYGTVDFDASAATYNVTSQSQDAFILKLDSVGEFEWVKVIGGNSSDDDGRSIKLDGEGNIIVAGNYSGTIDFDPGLSTYFLTGAHDAFIMKLSSHGIFLWARGFGSGYKLFGSITYAFDLATDAYKNIYLVGSFSDTLFYYSANDTSFVGQNKGAYDAYLIKLSDNGNYEWGVSYGGLTFDYATSIKIDDGGNVFVIGSFEQGVDFDPSLIYSYKTSVGKKDIYISKYNTSGIFDWVKTIGSSDQDYGNAITINGTGVLYATGFFEQTADFNPEAGIHYLTPTGTRETYILKLNNLPIDIPENNSLKYALVYPNPTEEDITIQIPGQGNFSYTLYSINGNVLLRGSHHGTESLHLTLPNAAGMYILEINKEQEVSRLKIIKR